MGLSDYSVKHDHFEQDDDQQLFFFPCIACVHKRCDANLEPCYTCGHINSVSVGQINPTIAYHVTLTDLALFAEAAAELDTLKNYVDLDRPEETYRIRAIAERMHAAIERAAGADGCQIYAPDDTNTEQTS